MSDVAALESSLSLYLTVNFCELLQDRVLSGKCQEKSSAFPVLSLRLEEKNWKFRAQS